MKGTMLEVAHHRRKNKRARSTKKAEPLHCQHCKRFPSITCQIELFQCVCCQGPWYCSKACQLADWGAHQADCYRQSQKQQFYLYGAESLANVLEAEYCLSKKEEEEETEPQSPLQEAQTILEMLRTTTSQPTSCRNRSMVVNHTLWVPLLQRLLENQRHLLRALCQPPTCSSSGKDQQQDEESDDQFYLLDTVMAQLLDADLCMLESTLTDLPPDYWHPEDRRTLERQKRPLVTCLASSYCHNKRLSVADPWCLPSCCVGLELLRAIPEDAEDDLFGGDCYYYYYCCHAPPPSPVLWSCDRSFDYLIQNCEHHFCLCCQLMDRVLDQHARLPAPWIQHCVALWEHLVACLSRVETARAVLWAADESLREFDETPQVGLKKFLEPLLRLFSPLKWHQGILPPLYEAIYHAAALLVAQSQQLQHFVVAKEEGNQHEPFDLHTNYLETLILNSMSSYQIKAWNDHYLQWATAIVVPQYHDDDQEEPEQVEVEELE